MKGSKKMSARDLQSQTSLLCYNPSAEKVRESDQCSGLDAWETEDHEGVAQLTGSASLTPGDGAFYSVSGLF